jgi:uncharacterized tellurite resistance protein B-like protein
MNIHLTDFDESQRADYMTVVASMAAVDGSISSEELYSLRELCKYFVLGPSARGQVMAASSSPPADLDEIVQRLGSGPLRYSLLLDVAAMAYRDGILTPEEKAEYARLSELMGVPDKHSASIWKFAEGLFAPGYTPAMASEGIDQLDAEGIPRGSVRISACMLASGFCTPETGRQSH